MFVLIMQFLWKYVEDLVGKGLEWQIILEFIFFASASLVPLALPLAVLLSSIMTFGSLGEFSELTAVKSSGISIIKFMRPLMVLILFLMVGAFFFSNYVLPVANLKYGSLLYDITQKKPALQLKPGVFYNGIDGYSIKIRSKSKDNVFIQDVIIYDHTAGRGNVQVISAKRGKMFLSNNDRYLSLILEDGQSYEELYGGPKNKLPHLVTHFSRQTVHFDLSAFRLNRTDEELFKTHYSMLNIRQLGRGIDSLGREIKKRNQEVNGFISQYYRISTDTAVRKPVIDTSFYRTFASLKPEQKRQAVNEALNQISTVKSYSEMLERDVEARKKEISRFNIEWHRKFTLSFACFVLFLIGAPLGAIIKRGGLGLPMVFCIIFFLIYHVLSVVFEKMSRELVIEPAWGMWMSSLVLFPVGVFLMIKANDDSKLFDSRSWGKLFKKLLPEKK